MLRAFFVDHDECRFHGLHCDAQQRDWEENDGVSQLRQFRNRKERALAELGHVGHQGHVERIRDLFEFLTVFQCFYEKGIGACIEIGASAVQGSFQPFQSARIGPRDDDQIGIGARLDGGSNLGDHGSRFDETLSREMAAPLGEDLIFELNGGGSGRLEFRHGAHDIDGFSKPGIRIDNHG